MRLVLDIAALDLNDFVDFEESAGCSPGEAVADMMKHRATAAQQRALIWVFARKIDPFLSIEDAGTFRPGEVEWTTPDTAEAD